MTTQQRITEISELEGLPIKDASRMPHPTVLSGWLRKGFYWIDADKGVFRLTKGDFDGRANHKGQSDG